MLKGFVVKLALLVYVLFGCLVSMNLIGYITYAVIGLFLGSSRYFCLDCKRFSLRYFTEKDRDEYGGPPILIHFRYCGSCGMAQIYRDHEPDGSWSMGFSKWRRVNAGDFPGATHYH